MPTNKLLAAVLFSSIIIWGTIKIYKVVVGSLELQRIHRIEEAQRAETEAKMKGIRAVADKQEQRKQDLIEIQKELARITNSNDTNESKRKQIRSLMKRIEVSKDELQSDMRKLNK